MIIAYLGVFISLNRLFFMTKLLRLAISLLLLSTTAFSQTADEKLAEIQGKWQTSQEGFLQFRRTVELPELPKLDIYKRAKVYYLTHPYKGQSEKAAGSVILLGGTSTLEGVQVSERDGVRSAVDATYYLHIAAEDGKAVLVITCIQYLFHIDSGRDSAYDEVLISRLYPVNPHAQKSDAMIDAFYGTAKSASALLDEIEKVLKEELP
jgi:hypothetical protein